MPDIKTLDDIVSYTTQYDIRTVCLLDRTEDIVYIQTHLFDKYRPIVEQFIQEYKVNPKDKDRYNFKPDILSNRIYGTPDLYWLILYLNNIESPSRFKTPRILKLIPKDKIDEIFDILLTKNVRQIEKNRLEVEA